MPHSATFEHLGGPIYALRVHPSADAEHGAPWTFGCVIVRQRPPWWKRAWLKLTGRRWDVVAFMALAERAPTPEEAAAMREAALAAGYTHRAYKRHRNGRWRLYKIKL